MNVENLDGYYRITEESNGAKAVVRLKVNFKDKNISITPENQMGGDREFRFYDGTLRDADFWQAQCLAISSSTKYGHRLIEEYNNPRDVKSVG